MCVHNRIRKSVIENDGVPPPDAVASSGETLSVPMGSNLSSVAATGGYANNS